MCRQAARTLYGTSYLSVCNKHPPEIGCQSITCNLQLIHGDTSFPSVQTVVHAQGLDDMHSCLAHSRACLRHNKSLHCAVLPFHHMHPDRHMVGALLTPTSEKKRKDYAFQRQLYEKPSIIPGCPGTGTTCTLYACATYILWLCGHNGDDLSQRCMAIVSVKHVQDASSSPLSRQNGIERIQQGKAVVTCDLFLTHSIMMSLCFCIPDMDQSNAVACQFAE